MYTFILSVIAFFLLSALIYGRKLQRRILPVVFIIFCGTLITTIIVNGIIQKNYPYHREYIKTKIISGNIDSKTSDTSTVKALIAYDIKSDYLNIHEIGFGGTQIHDTNHVKIIFITDSITKPSVIKYLEVKTIDSKWISNIGIPRQNPTYDLYLPNDSIHHLLINNFLKYKRRKIS